MNNFIIFALVAFVKLGLVTLLFAQSEPDGKKIVPLNFDDLFIIAGPERENPGREWNCIGACASGGSGTGRQDQRGGSPDTPPSSGVPDRDLLDFARGYTGEHPIVSQIVGSGAPMMGMGGGMESTDIWAFTFNGTLAAVSAESIIPSSISLGEISKLDALIMGIDQNLPFAGYLQLSPLLPPSSKEIDAAYNKIFDEAKRKIEATSTRQYRIEIFPEARANIRARANSRFQARIEGTTNVAALSYLDAVRPRLQIMEDLTTSKGANLVSVLSERRFPYSTDRVIGPLDLLSARTTREGRGGISLDELESNRLIGLTDSAFDRKLGYVEERLLQSAAPLPLDTDIKRIGLAALKIAQREHTAGNIEVAEGSLETAILCLNFLIALNPEIAMIKDLYEAIIGKDLLTGRDLTESERILAAVSFATLGTLSSARLASRVLHGISEGRSTAASIAAAEQLTAKAADLGLELRPLSRRVRIDDIRDASVINTEIALAERARTGIPEVAGEFRAPFPRDSIVVKTTVEENISLARVHGDHNRIGPWLVAQEDIAGLSRESVAVRLNLPGRPVYHSTVEIPAGTSVWMGSIGGGSFGLENNVRQFYVPGGIDGSWITTTSLLR